MKSLKEHQVHNKEDNTLDESSFVFLVSVLVIEQLAPLARIFDEFPQRDRGDGCATVQSRGTGGTRDVPEPYVAGYET
ncbi:MAG: hypothetical protein JSU72_07005 [Deltaproteobacteria bacterium]|nr:MAG: hypothetical protein JSU72_07005 [Deltaproteobacteria bacterium]